MKRASRGQLVSLVALLVCGAAFLVEREAGAQCPAQPQMIDLNRQAMEHYENLAVDEALAALQQAVAMPDSCISASVRARSYMNLGVVQVGGFMNNADGIMAFRTALCLDASVTLDPLTSTPDIQTAFRLARSQNEQQGCPAGVAGPPAGGGGPPPGGGGGPPPGGGGGPPPGGGGGGGGAARAFELFRHRPLEQQERTHPVPLYIEVNPAVQVGSVVLFYRVAGETQYTELQFESFGSNAFGVTIPCDTIMLFDPAWVEYYIEIRDPSGARIGMAPEEGRERPYRVAMVQNLAGDPPSLPGRPPPAECVNCSDIAPGMPVPPECRGGGAGGGGCESGFTCDVDDDCPGGGYSCTAGCCMSAGGGGGGRSGGFRPWWYLQVGVGWGGGLVLNTDEPSGDNIPTNALYENVGDTADCPPDQDVRADWGASTCWYSTNTAGFGMGAGHLRVYTGVYILPFLSAGLYFRYQFDGFNTAYHFNWALGLRARYHIIQNEHMELSVGLSFQIYGWEQVYLNPITLSTDRTTGRLWRPGGYNAIGVMVGFAYYFIRNFGLFAEVTSDWTMGEFMWNIELSVGPTLRF